MKVLGINGSPRKDGNTAHMLKTVFQELNKEGIETEFFQLGGNSLSILQLNRQINQALNVDIPEVAMFNYLTIRSFAGYLKDREAQQEKDKVESAIQAEKKAKGKERLKQRMKRRART